MFLIIAGLANMQAYSLTDADQQIIEAAQSKIKDFSQPKRATLYNILNKYILSAAAKDTRGYALLSKITPIIYDELKTQQGHAAPSTADLSIQSIESKATFIQVTLCDKQRAYE